MKKKILIMILILAVAAGAGYAYYTGVFSVGSSESESDASIYVDKLSSIMGLNSSYTVDTFMGVVEGQETVGINKSSEREVDKVLVSVGDTVEEGTALFTYKTDSLASDIVQMNYDIEGYNLQIADYNRQIENLTKTRDKAAKENPKDTTTIEDYNNQIAAANMQIEIIQNSIDQTNTKIAEAQKKINNSTVYSTTSGVVQSIYDANSTSSYNTSNNDGSYISILASDEMKVKGQINEQNVYSINVGEAVTLRSRVDETQTWTGVIDKIDTESKSESDSNMYYSTSGSDTTSTKYPFYVKLDSSEGLMMGQHLYIELNPVEETETLDLSSGTYIYSYYISYDDDGNPYVWAASSKNTLEKRAITLGDYNETMDVYEVTNGLSYDDQLAFPMEDYTEGMACVSANGEE